MNAYRNSFAATLRAALMLFVLLTVLTGLVYPLVVTAVAQLAFPGRAAGSVVTRGAHRSELRRSRAFLGPAVGDHAAALQRHRLQRLESRAAEPGARRGGEGARRRAACGRSRQPLARAHRPGDGLSERPRPRGECRGRKLP